LDARRLAGGFRSFWDDYRYLKYIMYCNSEFFKCFAWWKKPEPNLIKFFRRTINYNFFLDFLFFIFYLRYRMFGESCMALGDLTFKNAYLNNVILLTNKNTIFHEFFGKIFNICFYLWSLIYNVIFFLEFFIILCRLSMLSLGI